MFRGMNESVTQRETGVTDRCNSEDVRRSGSGVNLGSTIQCTKRGEEEGMKMVEMSVKGEMVYIMVVRPRSE